MLSPSESTVLSSLKHTPAGMHLVNLSYKIVQVVHAYKNKFRENSAEHHQFLKRSALASFVHGVKNKHIVLGRVFRNAKTLAS